MIFLDQFNSTLLDSAWVGMAQLGSAWLSLFKLILTQLNSAQPGLTRLSIAIGSILALKLKRLPFCSNTFEFFISGPRGSFRVRIPRWTPNPSVGFSTPLLPTAIWRTAAYGSRGVCCSPSSTFGCCSSSNSRSIYK